MPVLGGDTLDSNVVAGVGKGTDLDIYCSTFYAVGGDPEFDAGFTKYMEDNATAAATPPLRPAPSWATTPTMLPLRP